MKRALLISLLVSTAGCAAPAQVVQTNPGVYSLSVGAMGVEGGEAGAKNKGLAAASHYCGGLGKRLDVQEISSKGPVEWGSAAGSATITFKCTT